MLLLLFTCALVIISLLYTHNSANRRPAHYSSATRELNSFHDWCVDHFSLSTNKYVFYVYKTLSFCDTFCPDFLSWTGMYVFDFYRHTLTCSCFYSRLGILILLHVKLMVSEQPRKGEIMSCVNGVLSFLKNILW